MYDKLLRPIVEHEGFMLFVILGVVALLMLAYAIFCAVFVYRSDHGKKTAEEKENAAEDSPEDD